MLARRRLTRRRAVLILTISAIFIMLVAAFHGLTDDLATTAAIVLIWLGAGLTIGLLMAKSR